MQDWGSRFKIRKIGIMVWGSWFKVELLGLRVHGLGVRVYGIVFKV